MFGLRSDGRKIKSLDPMFRVIPHVMKERSDAHVYFSQDIPIKSLDPLFRVIPHVMKERSDAHVYFSQEIPIKTFIICS